MDADEVIAIIWSTKERKVCSGDRELVDEGADLLTAVRTAIDLGWEEQILSTAPANRQRVEDILMLDAWGRIAHKTLNVDGEDADRLDPWFNAIRERLDDYLAYPKVIEPLPELVRCRPKFMWCLLCWIIANYYTGTDVYEALSRYRDDRPAVRLGYAVYIEVEEVDGKKRIDRIVYRRHESDDRLVIVTTR